MNYEQKYKEALERAKEWKDGKYGHQVSDTPQEIAEFIFPELKESEDEQIRKWIIDDIRYNMNNEPLNDSEYKKKAEKAIAWLEKQNKDSQVTLPQFTFDDILALQCCMETVKKVQEDKDLYEKLNDLHNRLHDAYHLEKQGKQKSVWHNEGEEPQKDSLILLIMQSGIPVVAKVREPHHTFTHGERWAYIEDLLEKQGEQKSADTVERYRIFGRRYS